MEIQIILLRKMKQAKWMMIFDSIYSLVFHRTWPFVGILYHWPHLELKMAYTGGQSIVKRLSLVKQCSQTVSIKYSLT